MWGMPGDKPSLTFTCISSPGMSVIWLTLEVESVTLSPTAGTGRLLRTICILTLCQAEDKMKIRLSELRNLIREAVEESTGGRAPGKELNIRRFLNIGLEDSWNKIARGEGTDETNQLRKDYEDAMNNLSGTNANILARKAIHDRIEEFEGFMRDPSTDDSDMYFYEDQISVLRRDLKTLEGYPSQPSMRSALGRREGKPRG
jgi:hypothetical protein